MEQVEYLGVTGNFKKTVSCFQVIMALFSFWPQYFKGWKVLSTELLTIQQIRAIKIN